MSAYLVAQAQAVHRLHAKGCLDLSSSREALASPCRHIHTFPMAAQMSFKGCAGRQAAQECEPLLHSMTEDPR